MGTPRESRGVGYGGPGGHPVTCQLCASQPALCIHKSVWTSQQAVSTAHLGFRGDLDAAFRLCPPLGPFLPSLSHPCLGLELDSGVSSGGGQARSQAPTLTRCLTPWRFPEQASVAGGVTWVRAWAKLPASKGSWARLGAGRPDPSPARHLPVPTTSYSGATCSRAGSPSTRGPQPLAWV